MAVGCVHAARFLHNNLLHQTMRLPMSFFDTTPLGRIVNRFSRDVDVVDNILPQIMRIWIMMIFNVSMTNVKYILRLQAHFLQEKLFERLTTFSNDLPEDFFLQTFYQYKPI